MKSTVSGTLALNAVQEGLSVCAYSGELPAEVYLEWIMLQATESKYIGYKTDQRTGQNLCTISPLIQQRIREWIDGKFFLYDNSCIMDEKQEESILKVFEACARRYGCKLFILDNLMSALTSADEENKAQAKFMARIKAFASKYKVHVIVVAHPRKEKADATFTNDSVAGSSVITNLADNVINVERPNLRITKNRYYGKQDLIVCNFDPCNRRIFQESTGDRIVYGWNHEGVELPENPASSLPEFAIQTSKKEPF